MYDMSKTDDGKTLPNQNYLGFALFNVHEIVCSPSHTVTRLINGASGKKQASITVYSEEKLKMSQNILMGFKLKSMPTPREVYIKVFRSISGYEDFTPIYQSESITRPGGNFYSEFSPIEISVNSLCRGVKENPILIQLIAPIKKRGFKVLGSLLTTYSQLLTKTNNWEGSLKLNSKPVATLSLYLFSITSKNSFLDYISGGCNVSLIIGIDFTKSNGFPNDKSSLHYLGNKESAGLANEYISAIKVVGDILQYYDSDKRIPVYGFGAKLPPDFECVSHCFALNGNIFDPEVNGIDEVLEVYEQSVNNVSFYGPTVFSQLIETVIHYASAEETTQENQQYFVLLMLTDGIINDMEATIDAVIKASQLPISIIIVGIGEENFEMMDLLDSDDKLLTSTTGRQASRDIVQFVPFRIFRDRTEELAREVLSEIPRQLVSYMNNRGIVPNPPKDRQEFLTSSTVNPYTNSKSLQACMTQSLTTSCFPREAMLEDFTRKLEEQGHSQDCIQELVKQGVPTLDISHAIKLIRNIKPKIVQQHKSSMKKVMPVPNLNLPPSRPRSAEGKICIKCQEKRVNTVLLECGHSVLCLNCVSAVGKLCPECRNPIVQWRLVSLV